MDSQNTLPLAASVFQPVPHAGLGAGFSAMSFQQQGGVMQGGPMMGGMHAGAVQGNNMQSGVQWMGVSQQQQQQIMTMPISATPLLGVGPTPAGLPNTKMGTSQVPPSIASIGSSPILPMKNFSTSQPVPPPSLANASVQSQVREYYFC